MGGIMRGDRTPSSLPVQRMRMETFAIAVLVWLGVEEEGAGREEKEKGRGGAAGRGGERTKGGDHSQCFPNCSQSHITADGLRRLLATHAGTDPVFR
mgnify:CR=1 FL=1